MVSFACAVILLVAMPGLALKARPAREPIGRLESIPMMTYKQDCWKKRPVSLAQVPGAGINEFEPFELVEKDGYYSVACVKDYMFYFGDKFGDNKHDYKLGSVSNVSIVHYDAHVPKEDRETMTEKVCFRFCRTVPDMLFFGIVNGRDCYCAPYYKPMESDSSSCDVVCPGKPTTTCGGETKSSIFQMHMCNDAEADMETAIDKAESMIDEMETKTEDCKKYGDDMQASGEALQPVFSKVGDNDAGDLMQSAKVFAGKLASAERLASKDSAKLELLVEDAKKITNFNKPSELSKAENLMEDINEQLADAVASTETLDKTMAYAPSSRKVTEGAADQYMPIMYFVDAKEKDYPSTCTGDVIADPIVGDSMDGCASACDDAATSDGCVGFSYFKVDGDESLCFLLSKFTKATYYSDCDKSSASAAFLQAIASKASPDVTCVAKYSSFAGMNLKPDKSGKCKQCLKKLTAANRCYK
eukprot:gnl/TRDRNA2_/TRDRNA2_84066_c0_seq2.p1 gnl/TRDRNA2_/TRDRNA2_84066_c0~~gnl/TRDRNA2_/TRDRNA2_84066_c0_seq2.p1  ORF type:complete len:498 (+),score=128.28 gnl/TRDRNA2_/TRDRNA2_84066_c0_seq2:78-1496(+)